MARGYMNVGLPPGMVRELRPLAEEQYLGYTSMADIVRMATQLWLVEVKKLRECERRAREVGRAQEVRSRPAS